MFGSMPGKLMPCIKYWRRGGIGQSVNARENQLYRVQNLVDTVRNHFRNDINFIFLQYSQTLLSVGRQEYADGIFVQRGNPQNRTTFLLLLCRTNQAYAYLFYSRTNETFIYLFVSQKNQNYVYRFILV